MYKKKEKGKKRKKKRGNSRFQEFPRLQKQTRSQIKTISIADNNF